MKKGQAKNSRAVKSSSRAGHHARKSSTSKQKSSVTTKSMNAANYAKAISYIVKSEEDETQMMIASTSNVDSY